MDEKDMNQEALKREEEKVLCGANSYREQYFFNPRFSLLHKEVQESLQKITVTYTEEGWSLSVLRKKQTIFMTQ